VSSSDPLRAKSSLEDVLICVPEEKEDLVWFELGAQKWPSNGNYGPQDVPRCTVDKWSWNKELLQKVSNPDKQSKFSRWRQVLIW